jgi:hypothetical protein
LKLSYIGPHIDGVTVPLPTGGFITAAHGGTVDVPDSVAAGLLEQASNWVKAVVKRPDPVKETVKDGEAN